MDLKDILQEIINDLKYPNAVLHQNTITDGTQNVSLNYKVRSHYEGLALWKHPWVYEEPNALAAVTSFEMQGTWIHWHDPFFEHYNKLDLTHPLSLKYLESDLRMMLWFASHDPTIINMFRAVPRILSYMLRSRRLIKRLSESTCLYKE